MSQDKDPNQGEGDRASARRYDKHVREFIDDGKVDSAATEAKQYVDRDPSGATAAEDAAKHGPKGGSRRASVEEIVAKGQSLIDRVRPMVRRAVGNLRHRFGRK